MTISKVCLLAALSSLLILASFTGGAQSVSCCLKYTRRPLPCNHLLGYTIQTINTSCDISAIIFHLPRRFVCADPSMKWTQRGVACVDKARKEMAKVLGGVIPGTKSA